VTSGSGVGPYKVSWSTEGTKAVSLTVTQDGCVDGPTVKQIEASYPYDMQQICLVMVDEDTEKNMIVWERNDDPATGLYRIYREAVSTDYEAIGEVSQADYSQFVDLSSSPQNKNSKYKIAVVDTCGNESDLSDFHQPIFLQVNNNVTNNNLNWSIYKIEDGSLNFKTLYILGGADSLDLHIIDSVSGAAEPVYTDDRSVALDGRYYYRIKGILFDECTPSGNLKAGTGPYNHSLSNMDDNKLKETSVEDMLIGVTGLRVFPNPFRDHVRVEYQLQNASDVKIEVYNLLGVRVLEVENTRQSPGQHAFDISTEKLEGSSLYYLRFSVDGSSSVIKLVPAL
jgi:hypothetical protein